MAAGEGRVLRELRRSRRRRHFSDVDVWDALYRIYVAAIFGSLGVAVVSGYVGGDPVTAATLDRVIDDGAAVLGVVIATVVGLGARTGGRGGPIALEPADVHVVLLAPVSRWRALLGPALRQVRFSVFLGSVVGAVAGNLASRRLPGGASAWIGWGGVTGAATGVASVGAALVVSGLRGGRWASVVALALIGWSTADLLAGAATAPTTLLGQLALRPIDARASAWIGLAWAPAVGAAGLLLLGRTAIAAAQRRAALIAQLRFAVTVQDIRTVVLLRRTLAQEGPRSDPWFGLRGGIRHPVWRRDAQGVLRWPAVRLGRLVVLGAVAGGTLVLVWRGTTALVVVAGGALLIAALDASEGLAQEGDLPTRRDTLPVDRRWLTVQHMLVPFVVMVGTAIAGTVAVVAGGRVPEAAVVAGVTILPAALGAVVGAVLSISSEPVDALSSDVLVTPELLASTRFVVRMGAAPGVAIAGTLPVLAARTRTGADAAAAAGGVSVALVLALGGALFLYWRRREAVG